MAASSSPEPGDMHKQAQHLWAMLDELADSDPEAYKKFIEKNMKEGKEVMVPAKTYMCVKTKILRPKSYDLYINMCSWTRVPKPDTDEDPISVTGGPLEENVDGKECYKIVRLAINPYVLDECCKHAEEKDMLIQLGLKYLEHQHNIGISRRYKILEDTQYKGDPSLLMKNFFLKKDDTERKNVDDFLSNVTNMSPDSLLTQLGRVSMDDTANNNSHGESHISITSLEDKHLKSGLIEEISSNDVQLEVPDYEMCVRDADGRKPRRVVVEVSLPQVLSVKGCELDITEDEISLTADDTYQLNISLPELINENATSAKFSTKNSSLTITLPTLNQT
ncbi:PIH1 domain-containing protein 2-like [Amphiura filiformis]|uniref:PIH1 domain-containing protein 2-like n=1 Tax=Amphiura filiformis TaxID=82378 RepID=UPI003B21122C